MAINDYIRLTDAATEYNLSRTKLSLLVRQGTLNGYTDPRDKRVTLLSRQELDGYFRVRPKEKTAQS